VFCFSVLIYLWFRILSSKPIKMQRLQALIILQCVLCIIPASCQLVKIPVCERIDSFHIDSFKEGKLIAHSIVSIKNENWFSFTGDSLEMEVFKNHALIGKGIGTKEIEFERNSSVELPMNVELYADSLKEDLTKILHQDSMDVQVIISGRFSRLGILKTAEITTRIPVKPLVNSILSQSLSSDGMKIEKLRVVKSNVNTTTMGFDIEYNNQLPFDMTLKKLDFSFFADNKFVSEIGRWNKEVDVKVEQKNATKISGEVVLDNIKAGQSGLLKLMTSGSTWVDYYMKGIAYVDVDSYSIEVPAIIHFEMDILSNSIRIIP